MVNQNSYLAFINQTQTCRVLSSMLPFNTIKSNLYTFAFVYEHFRKIKVTAVVILGVELSIEYRKK